MIAMLILPGTGRGTARRRRVVERLPEPLKSRTSPSTALRAVPLPLRGRIS